MTAILSKVATKIFGSSSERVMKGLWPVVAGLTLGIAAALGTTRVLGQMLFEVRPSDPVTLAGVVLLLLTAAFVAVLVPARRAARVDPLIAVRCE